MFTSIESLNNSIDDIDIIIHDAGQYRLIGEKYPHERIFIELLLNKIGKNPELSIMFYVFVDEYFPKYHWHYINYQDYLSMTNIECSSYHFLFIKAYRYKLAVAKKGFRWCL